MRIYKRFFLALLTKPAKSPQLIEITSVCLFMAHSVNMMEN